MKKVELLAPVGNMESLYQAIHNGADAVYLAGKKYGARSYAQNFNEEEIIDAIKYCHLYGVRVYVTVNTIIFEREKDEFLSYLEFLYKNNVDAVIMQDIGMIAKVRSFLPNLEVHASTQLHNHNIEGIRLLEKMGVSRIVMAREMSLDEISKIDTNLEKEVFVHGALCIGYSGCCLFSSMNTNRSGNRGECIASCRLTYRLLENNKEVKTYGDYLLSTKELNTVKYIDKLIESGINSFKIEGRMKSPEYVGLVTKIYRQAIDSYYNNKKFAINEELLKKMSVLFNRDYTKGFLFNDKGSSLMNIKAPNHQGIYLGKVIEFNNKEIKIKLDEEINQEDGIRLLDENKGMIVNRLYNEKKQLVNHLNKGEIAILDNKINCSKKGIVNKTIDKKLIEELKKIKEKKITINAEIFLKKNLPLKLVIWDDDGNKVIVSLKDVEEAINRPLDLESVKKQITRLGNTPFTLNNIDIYMDDDVFVNNKELNEIRRIACDKLIEQRKNKKISSKNNPFLTSNKKHILEKSSLNVLVRTKEQLDAAKELAVDNIYITDYLLYQQNKSNNMYYVLPRVINNYHNYENENLLVRELGSINKYSENNNISSDYTLNIVNSDSIKLLESFGVKRVGLSPEALLNELECSKYNIEYVVYGRIELMITKYCPVNMILNNDDLKCILCRNNAYSLKDMQGRIYPMLHDKHLTTIFDHKVIDFSSNFNKLKGKINNFRIDLFDESYSKAKEIITKFKELI